MTTGPDITGRITTHRWICRFPAMVFFAFVSFLPVNTFGQVVIVHPSIAEDALSRTAARAIFSGRLHTLGGQRLTVFVFDDNHATHVNFSKNRLGVFPYQLRQAWSRAVFTGTGSAPVTVTSEGEMIRRVRETSGGIGYIDEDILHEGTRILTIEGAK